LPPDPLLALSHNSAPLKNAQPSCAPFARPRSQRSLGCCRGFAPRPPTRSLAQRGSSKVRPPRCAPFASAADAFARPRYHCRFAPRLPTRPALRAAGTSVPASSPTFLHVLQCFMVPCFLQRSSATQIAR